MRYLIAMWTALFLQAGLGIVAHAESEHSWDQAEAKCMDVFNKSYGNHTDNLSTCKSKPGVNMNYQLSLDLWKRGVAGGSILGESDPSYQGALDAETNFKSKNNDESSKWEKLKEKSKATIQKDNEGTLGRMPDCVLVGVANQLLEAGKSCGMGISKAMNSEQYQTAYEGVCLTQTHNAAKCKKLSGAAYQAYLSKMQAELK